MTQIFRGCNEDGLKISMFLRGILLRNFHEIIKEVALVCGAITVSSLFIHLYCPQSLRAQYQLTSQIDVGISNIFSEEEQRCRIDRTSVLTEGALRNLTPSSSVFFGHDSKALSDQQCQTEANRKIKLMDDFIGSGHFPFGAEIDSSTTELSLN